MKGARQELARLIQAGLAGRTPKQLWLQIRGMFKKTGLTPPAWDTFTSWASGECFPATQRRQDVLADAVGGPCGVAIKLLGGTDLAFRYFRRKAREKEKMSVKTHAGHGLKGKREFAWVMRPDESGKLVGQLQIMCGICHATYHYNRRGKIEAEDWFTKKGWEVGRSAVHDVCPNCIAARKVVKMADHKKPTTTAVGALLAEKEAAAAAEKKVMGPSDRRLLSRFIEDHWDEHVDIKAYRLGWNDARIAKEAGVPLDWVKEVRELLFGASGEDPGVAQFIAEQVKIRTTQADTNDTLRDLVNSLAKVSSSLTEITSEHNKISRTIDGVKQKQGGLADQVRKLSEIAEKIQHPFDKAG